MLFELPSNIVLRKVGTANWLGFLAFAWGTVMLGQGFVPNYSALAACRFLLGLFEAGFFPGCAYLITVSCSDLNGPMPFPQISHDRGESPSCEPFKAALQFLVRIQTQACCFPRLLPKHHTDSEPLPSIVLVHTLRGSTAARLVLSDICACWRFLKSSRLWAHSDARSAGKSIIDHTPSETHC